MQVIEKSIKSLKPYKKNPRKNDGAVDAVKASIEAFGFKVPLVIDKNGVVVTGHTRLKAAKALGLKTVPCVVADDLNEQQINAFRLADNKVGELADWDYGLLDEEINAIFDIDMGAFGFEFTDAEFEHEVNKAQTQGRVMGIHNADIAIYDGVGPYDIPQISPVYETPKIDEWIGFNYVLTEKNPENKGVHFFVDDYQFERVWNNPEGYVEKLKQFAAVCSPDFSPYGDMPMATQIFNHYRKHWVSAYWQAHGITVIPTIRASADPRSLEWYLDGEPRGGIVMISAMWTSDKDIKDFFLNYEYKNMLERLNPKKIYVYSATDIAEQLGGNVEPVKSYAAARWGGEHA